MNIEFQEIMCLKQIRKTIEHHSILKVACSFFEKKLPKYLDTCMNRAGEVPQITTSTPVHQSLYLQDLPFQSSPKILLVNSYSYRSSIQFLFDQLRLMKLKKKISFPSIFRFQMKLGSASSVKTVIFLLLEQP